jgi:pyrimidine-nucleoside phosphorylase
MESILGYRTDLTTEEFLKQLAEIGLVLTGQSADLAPADGKLYALRDVTGTVPSIPLIATSVMSKKIAAGAQAIVLDVKSGNGAFMKTVEGARILAETMVWIGELSGRSVVGVLSDMNQPLGHAVGNALEVREAIETLKGGGPEDFCEHCLVIAGHMLALGGVVEDEEAGRAAAAQAIADGRAWERFTALVEVQGGDLAYVEEPDRLPKAALIETVDAPRSGFLSGIHARMIGETAVLLGGGRAKKGDPIDHAVGIVIHHKVGDYVGEGDPLFTLHANHSDRLETARRRTLGAHQWSDDRVEPLPLFYGKVDKDNCAIAEDQLVTQDGLF